MDEPKIYRILKVPHLPRPRIVVEFTKERGESVDQHGAPIVSAIKLWRIPLDPSNIVDSGAPLRFHTVCGARRWIRRHHHSLCFPPIINEERIVWEGIAADLTLWSISKGLIYKIFRKRRKA